jgi:hypothetical protein
LVHLLLSSQAVPSFLLCGVEQAPVLVSQVPTMWHWSALHTTGLAPVHEPLTHVSVWVQALPSEQVAPSFLTGFEQVPVVESQVPAV